MGIHHPNPMPLSPFSVFFFFRSPHHKFVHVFTFQKRERERARPIGRSSTFFFLFFFPTIYLCLEFFSFLKHRTLLSTTCRHYRFYTRNKTLSWLGKLFIKLLHSMTKFQVPNKTWNTFTFHEFIAKFIFTLLYMNDI